MPALITNRSGQLTVPGNAIIPFIEGNGMGVDIWRAGARVLDAAVEKICGGKKKAGRRKKKMMKGATELKISRCGDAIIKNM